MSVRVACMAQTRTGIRIGIRTVPVQRIVITPDAVRVQAALLAKPRRPELMVGMVMALASLGVAAMAWADWLPPGVGA